MPATEAAVYRTVARLHAGNIDQGFLSSLGPRFLTLLYRAIDETEGSVLLTAEADGRVIGFVAGTTRLKDVYRSMLRRKAALALALLPSLFSPRRVKRILEIALYGGGKEKASAAPAAELLSISVDPAYRGRKFADRLYADLVEFFRARGVPEFKIIVGEPLEAAHKFYQRMGAKAVGKTEVHKGSVSVVYVHEVAPVTSEAAKA